VRVGLLLVGWVLVASKREGPRNEGGIKTTETRKREYEGAKRREKLKFEIKVLICPRRGIG